MKSAVKSEPDYEWGIRRLCDWLIAEESWDEVLPYCHELIRLDSSDPVSFGYRANVHLKRDDLVSAEDDLQRAFHLASDYGFAARELLRLRLDRKAFDEAERVVAVLEREVPSTSTIMRRVQLEGGRKQREAAFTALKALCEDAGAETWEIDTATEAIVAAGWGNPRTLELFFSELIQQAKDVNDLPPGLAAQWVHQAALRNRWKVHREIDALPWPSPFTQAAWMQYLKDADEHQWNKHLWRAIRRYGDRFRADDELWGQVGYYLITDKRYRKGVQWMVDWKQRENAEGWMLLNLAIALEQTKGVRTSGEVRRHALNHLSWDHTTSRHVVTLAFQSAIDGEMAECQALLSRAIDSEVPVYFQFVAGLTKSLIAGHDDDPDGAAERWKEACQARDRWYEDKGLRGFFWAYRPVAKPHFQGTRHRWILTKAVTRIVLRHINGIFE